VAEAKGLAGVAAITIPPDLLRTLASTEVLGQDIDELSLFTNGKPSKGNELERRTYMDDETSWREAFSKAYDGKGSRLTGETSSLLTNTTKAIDAFKEYQIKGEQLMLEKEKR
ncbi:MAG: hypothetical protein Q9198_009752, partial [Flavoplaca austrocitrina]